MIRALALLAFTATAATAAPVPKELKASVREGTWKLMKIDLPAGGVSTGMTHCWIINAKDEVSFRGPQEPSDEIRFRLIFDPAAKHCDYKTASMPVPHKGIYELAGDDLRIAIDFSGGLRPKDFSVAPNVYTYTFRRDGNSK
jgi:uncharacterized protein (TIGR03067 family)